MSVCDWLARREKLTPHKIALVDALNSNRQITYQDWNRAANQTANFFQQYLGIEKGDRVAVLAFNCVEYLEIWFALNKLGAILQNLNWRLIASELSTMIADAGSKAVIYGEDQRDVINEIRRGKHKHVQYVAIGKKADASDISLNKRESFSDLHPGEVALDWDDPWVICYTGGTTGSPKGAVLTYRSITANAVNTIISWGLEAGDITILNAPLYHTGGLNVFTAPLVYLGGTSIVCRDFNLDQTYDFLTGGEVTVWFGVPTMFVMMQNHPRWEQADFSHLKLMISGGAACPMPVFEKFWEKGVDFKTGYGLTEAGPNTFWLPPEDVQRKPGAVGFPLFHIDVRAVNPDGIGCEPEEVGELVIRGEHVCAGYWNNPQETEKTIHALPSEPDGYKWLHTGDLAYCDEEGYYYIVGRLKDMYISGGENVYPAEIESILYGHPSVVEAAVIGVPHDTWGEVGKAVVVIKPGEHTTEEDLLRYLDSNMARYKVPKSIVFVNDLPLTGANKVDKTKLLELFG